MPTLLIRNASHLATFDDDDHTFADASVFARDGVIEAVGAAADVPAVADRIVDARGCIVLPGLVNTHHHFCQTLTRAVPGAQDVELFDWLVTLYPIWANLGPDALRSATAIAIAELLRSGCTTASDHTYLWPAGCTLDAQIEVAREIGIRFHAARGAMSIGHSKGGLPPDSVVEDEAAILVDMRRLIETYHDRERYAMTRVVVAPCSPFSVSDDLMRESIALARAYGVMAHTHLAETLDEERFCLDRYGCRPVELAERLGWMGTDVWHAHMVHPSAAEVERLGQTRTGVAHCPTSNMRLGSGIAPLRALVDAGARVGLGVDGSASNDGSHLLDEARHAMLLARVLGGATALSGREALRIATRGGASVLGRDDIGFLAPGMAADVIGIRLDDVTFAGGAVHDPLAALVFCRPPNVDFSVVNGAPLIEHGRFTRLDIERTVARHNDLARALVTR
jgi:cytosine/adenosine deaminase-related metal-dependent hydrolase